MGGVVVADHVQRDPGVGAGDSLEERQELDVRVLLLAAVGDQAGRDLQPGEQCRCAVADVVARLLLGHPGADRQDRGGAVRSKAWIWAFSSMQTTTAFAG